MGMGMSVSVSVSVSMGTWAGRSASRSMGMCMVMFCVIIAAKRIITPRKETKITAAVAAASDIRSPFCPVRCDACATRTRTFQRSGIKSASRGRK